MCTIQPDVHSTWPWHRTTLVDTAHTLLLQVPRSPLVHAYTLFLYLKLAETECIHTVQDYIILTTIMYISCLKKNVENVLCVHEAVNYPLFHAGCSHSPCTTLVAVVNAIAVFTPHEYNTLYKIGNYYCAHVRYCNVETESSPTSRSFLTPSRCFTLPWPLSSLRHSWIACPW